MSSKLVHSFHENKRFLLTIFILLVVRSSLADQYLVPSGSMEPTIAIGDRIFVNKLAYDLQIPFTGVSVSKLGDPKRGDIVVFTNPKNGIRMVKRLVGLPGDELKIKDGFVQINGEDLNQKISFNEYGYVEKNGEQEYFVKRHPIRRLKGVQSMQVPEGHYFMMGDNRDNSSDSRAWGFVPRKNLIGKANSVLFSGNFLQKNPQIAWSRFGKSLYD